MATSIYYSWVWKSLIVNDSTFYTFYGKDFNPNVPSRPSSWSRSTTRTSWETSFNLTWFWVGNEVCCCLFMPYNNDTSNSVYFSWDMYFQKSYNGTDYYYAWWEDSRWMYIANNDTNYYYYYVWVDEDEIWIWETYYRFHIEWSSTDGSHDTIDIPFRVSNLSFDDSLHDSGYLWIEWNYLCYTDWIYGSRWYKHKINYDTWYSWWSWDPWYIRIPSWTTWRIYYTDEYWVVRRTHMADEQYWWAVFWYPWYIYVSDGDYTEWYWYLCFVDGNWEVRRLWNWVP